jgi:phosphoribosylformylglycinamidine cyclo-ligase
VLVAAKAQTDAVLAALRSAGEAPVIIGAITPAGGERSEAKGKGEAWAVAYSGALRYAS